MNCVLKAVQNVDHEKLKAIGWRTKLENEYNQRAAQDTYLRTLLKEKQSELDRLQSQYEGLVRIEAQQQAQMQKLRGLS